MGRGTKGLILAQLRTATATVRFTEGRTLVDLEYTVYTACWVNEAGERNIDGKTWGHCVDVRQGEALVKSATIELGMPRLRWPRPKKGAKQWDVALVQAVCRETHWENPLSLRDLAARWDAWADVRAEVDRLLADVERQLSTGEGKAAREASGKDLARRLLAECGKHGLSPEEVLTWARAEAVVEEVHAL